MSILLVEDDDNIAFVVKMVLEDVCKKQCIIASSVEEAVIKVKKENFEVILLDFFLKDGLASPVIETARSIYSTNPPIIILMTATEKDRAKEIAVKYKIKYIINKPFNIDILEETFSEIKG